MILSKSNIILICIILIIIFIIIIIISIYYKLYEIACISKITKNIYLSGMIGSINNYKLKQYNIKCIINCTKNIPNYYEDNNISYLRIPVDDTCDQHIEKYFDLTYNFIEKCIKENKKVLVHCRMGISRSATILIAYFMRKYNWSCDQAIEFVKSKRGIINPNTDFMNSLSQQVYELG